MRKLLIALSFIGTGTIVGGVTLPAIVSCVPITHDGILKEQLGKDYKGIHQQIVDKYTAMSPEQIQDAFMSFVFPTNQKMNMTHGYVVNQWSPIRVYNFNEEGVGFKREYITMKDLKDKHGSDMSGESIENKRGFLIYDETLRILANDFNKYKSLFKGYYEKSLVPNEETQVKEWDWTGGADKYPNSITINLKGIYRELNKQLGTIGSVPPELIKPEYARSLPLNSIFEQAVALIISFKNAGLNIKPDEQNASDSSRIINVSEDGILNWVNKYWEYSFKLDFLPCSYKSDGYDMEHEYIRTAPMEIFRGDLFEQRISPDSYNYYDLSHDTNIDKYLDTEPALLEFGLRWMNPKDLLDYFSGIINPLTLYGISNNLLRLVKDKPKITQEATDKIPKINLNFSQPLINSIHNDHIAFVSYANNETLWARFGGKNIYQDKYGSAQNNLRFLDATQFDIGIDEEYKYLTKI